MSLPETAHSAVSAQPPLIPVTAIEHAVQRQYGLCGDYSPLVSERDQNFHLRATGGAEYVVKVTSLAEVPIVSEFQIAALQHLEQVSGVRVPRVLRTLDGQVWGSIKYGKKEYKLRIVTYLAGDLLASASMDPDLVHDFGAKLATLDRGLHGFTHEGEQPLLLWDLQRAAELKDLLDHIEDPVIREPVSRAIDDFEMLVSPELGGLRSQVIHGDANPENVILDPSGHQVAGFIDFGDMVRAPLVFDVAIAAAYLRAPDTDALQLIGPFIAAYHAVNPLSDTELALLFDLVRARLATTITLLYWRLCARDDDDLYRQKTLDQEAGAICFLRALDKLGRAGFSKRLGLVLPH
jgi:Ser/Thr protein kinase RdoA (MazF antagonist)